MHSQPKNSKNGELSFKYIEQIPQINKIFHDLVNITAKFLETKITKLETSCKKSTSEIDDLKEEIREMNLDLQNLQCEDSSAQSKSKKETVTLSNEIKQYFQKRERSLEKLNDFPPSPDKRRMPSPHNDLSKIGYDSAVLKNSSSYKEFVHMMENVPSNTERKKSPPPQVTQNKNTPHSNNSNGEKIERKKSPPPLLPQKDRPKTKESEEKNDLTPNNKNKNTKKMYHYYFNSSNERKLNDLITDSQARKNPETANVNGNKNNMPRKNTNVKKKEKFQKELAKNYTVLNSKSKEKLLITEEGEVLDSSRTQKIGDNFQKKISAKSAEERGERENEKTLKTSAKSNQQSVSCDRTHEENKMKSLASASTKFLNYYYFFDKNKEIQQVEGEY